MVKCHMLNMFINYNIVVQNNDIVPFRVCGYIILFYYNRFFIFYCDI